MGWLRSSAVALLIVWASSGAIAERPALRVLLVGNSYTRFNIMPVLLQRVARSVPDGPRVEVEAVAHGGYTLRMHWRQREARARIRRRPYTHVVLQGHSLSPLQRREEMATYAARFGRLIDARSAHAVLYETWARAPEDRFYAKHAIAGPDAMQARVVGAYQRLAADISASVAPVGRAFAAARDRAPSLPLLRKDGSHPTVQGSYLAALVLYAAVSGVDPARVTYHPWHVSAEQATELRAVASQVAAGAAAAPGALARALPAQLPVRPGSAMDAPMDAPMDAMGGLY